MTYDDNDDVDYEKNKNNSKFDEASSKNLSLIRFAFPSRDTIPCC